MGQTTDDGIGIYRPGFFVIGDQGINARSEKELLPVL